MNPIVTCGTKEMSETQEESLIYAKGGRAVINPRHIVTIQILENHKKKQPWIVRIEMVDATWWTWGCDTEEEAIVKRDNIAGMMK